MHKHGYSICSALVVIAMTLLTGCAHRTQAVAREMVLPPSARTHVVESNQRFVMAASIEAPDPVYPADAQLDGTLRLCTTFVVNADGAVDDVGFDRESPACVEPGTPASTPFEQAVRTTLQQWRYFGAAVCTFPDGIDPDSDPRCDGAGVRVTPIPIRLRYVFTFSSERGGRVSRAQASPVR